MNAMTPIGIGIDAAAARQKIILIVDDIEDNRVLLDRALRSSGYVTMMAASGTEALSLMSSHVPDMVLLDWMMPGLSGLDTLRAMRELHPATRLPIIMCTAMGDEMSVVVAIGAGANDYMTKPISLPILRARMARIFEQIGVIDTLDTEKSRAEKRLSEQTRAMLGHSMPGRPGGLN